MHNDITVPKGKIAVIELGGTITSESETVTDEFYGLSSLDIESLCRKLPLPKQLNITIHRPFKLLSQDITEKHLMTLAKLITDLAMTDVDGFVVAMGTNAMEEVAFFIHIIAKTKKPIVFTGSIRQVNALGYEGERNLYHAILLAVSSVCERCGVLVCVNDVIYSARDFIKLNPSSIDAYGSNIVGPIGYVMGQQIKLCYQPNFIHTAATPFHLNRMTERFPTVVIIYGTLGDHGFLVNSAIENKVDGIISAGLGKGYQSESMTKALHKASQMGIPVVRCSRSGGGIVNFDKSTDQKFGFIAGASFSPAKARVLLAVALCHTKDKAELQDIFSQF